MTFLLGLLKPFALKIMAWAGILLAAAGALFYAVSVIRRGAKMEERASQMKGNLDAIRNAAKARDAVRADPDKRERLRDKYRKRGG